MDLLQAAEFRSRHRLSLRHVYAGHEPEPTKAVLQSCAALFLAGHHPASGSPRAVRTGAARRRSLSVRCDGGPDGFGGRPGVLLYLFSLLSAEMPAMFPVRWFAKFGLSALALLLACGLATAWVCNTPPPPLTNTSAGRAV